MKRRTRAAGLLGLAAGLSLLAACTRSPEQATVAASAGAELRAQTTASMAQHPGWQLASNCFQCHGTDGSGGFERLKGMSSSEFIKEMKELQVGTEADEAIMKVHAVAYTDAELAQMADYFSRAQ